MLVLFLASWNESNIEGELCTKCFRQGAWKEHFGLRQFNSVEAVATRWIGEGHRYQKHRKKKRKKGLPMFGAHPSWKAPRPLLNKVRMLVSVGPEQQHPGLTMGMDL